MKNCQTWVKDVMARLLEEEIVVHEAVHIVNNAPQN